MIRKMLVIAAAVAMPASALAAVTTVGASGVAGAAAKVYTSTSCALSGSVTFAAPGLSYTGTLGKKSTVTSVSSVTPGAILTGTGGCGATGITSKIATAATNCNVAPVPPATNPVICSSATTKLHYAYSNASNLATAGVSSIVASLGPKGIKLVDNGNKVVGAVTTPGTNSILPGGACGSSIGFSLAGATNVTGLTYTLNLCLVGDTGAGTSGAFFTDYLAAAGGNTSITIASATLGGATLSFVKV
jgi:hypothetical protein